VGVHCIYALRDILAGCGKTHFEADAVPLIRPVPMKPSTLF